MLCRFLALFILLLCGTTQAISLPGLGQFDPVPTAKPDSESDKTARIEQRLHNVQEQLQQLGSVTDDPRAYERKFLLEIQRTAYRQHLAALSGLKSQKGLMRYRAPIPAVASNVLAINSQHQQIQANQLEVDNLAAMLSTQESKLDELREDSKKSQAELRLKSEILEKAKPEQQRVALAELKLAQLKVDTQAALFGAREERLNYTRAQLQNSRERLQSLNEAIKDAPTQPKITSAEMADVESRLDTQRGKINAQIAQLLNEKQQWEAQAKELSSQREQLLKTYKPTLTKTKSRQTATPTVINDDVAAQLKVLSQRERINLIRLDNNAIRLGVLLDILNSQSIEGAFWQVYYANNRDLNSNDLSEFNQQSKKWDISLSRIESEAHQAIIAATMEAALITSDSPADQLERDLWLERAGAYRDAESEWARLRLIINRRSAEFAQQTPDKSIKMRADLWQDRTLNSLGSIWEYELFTVADTIEVDGQSVTIARGVTTGKVIYAILLITIGFLITIKLATWLERGLVRRMGWAAVSVRIAKRWLLSVAFIILLINSLLLVRIPLAAFAFMGGAIAIGLGFGMQTLLKNLISGLMMILERPFKLGETIEVGALRGTVVDMSVRAAGIRDINGIETLVPNSTFLEQNVTNWTYSSSLIRQTVKVGVAYGCDVRLVAKLLAEDVERHGQICPNPPAEILLEDFGADALMFAVYYWIDVNAGTLGRQVASDVRFMIEANFRKHDIAIAYPQRDVHLDIRHPVQVNLQDDRPPLATE